MHEFNYKCTENDYVFLHIPKSGGTSLNNILRDVKTHNIIGTSPKTGLHLGLNPEVKANYFTIIREPIERCWSHYHQWAKKYGHKKVYEILFDPPCSKTYKKPSDRVQALPPISDHRWACKLSAMSWQLNNIMCKKFCGTLDDNKISVDLAYKNLVNFMFVGDFRQIADSLKSIAKIFGINAASLPHENHHEYDRHIPSDFIDCCIAHNALDIELYQSIESKLANQTLTNRHPLPNLGGEMVTFL